MAQVFITKILEKEIFKKFPKNEISLILDSFEELAHNSKKGKSLANVANTLIKELKYKKYRFYFITDGHILKFGTEEELASLLIKFVRMSEKKDQQKIIEQIKKALQSFGIEGF